jgi:hypothetical protein
LEKWRWRSHSAFITKVGTDILTIIPSAGPASRIYTGGTTLDTGILEIGSLNPDSPSKTPLGTGNLALDGGILRTTSQSVNPAIPNVGEPITINVQGGYTQKAGGTLALGIRGVNGEEYDRVEVRGTAHVDGKLVINRLGTFRPKAEDSFIVLESGINTRGGQSLFGEFSEGNITDNLNRDNRLRLVVEHELSGVLLTYIEVKPTTPPGTTQPPVVEDDPTVTLPLVDPEAPIPEEEVVKILEPTAEQLTALYEISFSEANIQRLNLDDRMSQIQRGFVAPAPPVPVPPPTGKEAVGKEVVGKRPPAPVYQPGPRWGVWANGWGTSSISTTLPWQKAIASPPAASLLELTIASPST